MDGNPQSSRSTGGPNSSSTSFAGMSMGAGQKTTVQKQQHDVLSPKVIEGLLGTRYRGKTFGRSPLVAGSRNTMVVTADGQVYSWGWNDRATLGHGHQDCSVAKPRRVMGLQGVHIVQVAIGGWHALAVDSNGQCWAWGGNEYNQCAASEPGLRDLTEPRQCVTNLKVIQVSAGGMHSVALTDSGQIWMWGEPWGDFSMTVNREPRLLEISGPGGLSQHRDATFVVKVACGAFHNLALTASGHVYSWGINDYGQLGNGTTSNSTVPILIDEGLYGLKISDVAAGGWHSLAITEEGEVYVWGRGEYGRLGLGDKAGASKLRPTKVEGLEGHRVVEASCGGTHTVVVTDEGRIFIWGRGSFGRLGTGTEKNYFRPVEVALPGGPERWWVITAAAGGRHTMCLAVPDNGSIDEGTSVWDSRRASLSRTMSTLSLTAQDSGIDVADDGPELSAAKSRSSNHWLARDLSRERIRISPEEDADDEDEEEDEDEDGLDQEDEEDTDRRTSSEVEKETLISTKLIIDSGVIETD